MAASDPMTYMMATEAAAEIVSQKLETLLSHSVCIRCFAKEAKEKLATIQDFFSTNDRPSQSSVWWLRGLLQALYDAEDFIDKFHLRKARERHEALHMATRPLAALISKYNLWRNLSNLVNKMQELGKKEAEGKTRKKPSCSYSPASVPVQGEKLARLTSLWDRQASMNFLWWKEKNEIMDRIREGVRSEEFGCTSIWGEQGVGKTFLARWVCREATYLGFKGCAWVRLWASMDVQELLFEILKQMGELTREVKDMSWNEMRVKLSRGLAERKFLVVLDDILPSNGRLLYWLASIVPPYVPSHIIILTRDKTLAKTMNFPKATPIELRMLGPKEGGEVLASKLHGVPNGQSLWNEEGNLASCERLPLRISLLSGLLLNAGEQERAALVKNSSVMSLTAILQLSYHKLPVHLKLCFIYMALFPLTTPIPTRRLVRLWLAEGLLDSHCYNREGNPPRLPEHVGEIFILELAERNLIDVVSWRADGSPKACHMLSSLYDMILPIAMCTGFLHVHAASTSKDKNDRNPTHQQQQLPAQQLERTKVRWLAEHTNIVIASRGGSFPDFLLGHVRSFLSFCMRRPTKNASTFLRNMTSKTSYSLLRVLDLEGVYKPSLQGALHKLVLLRYLGLRCTVVDSLPSAVADLHYLETLDIKHTNITSLPSSLWKARNLRHLHLNWFHINLKTILKACSNNVMALTKLQTLSGLVTGEVKENFMRDHEGGLTTLTTLKLFLRRSGRHTSGAAVKSVADWISARLTNLQSLTFGVTKKAKPTKVAKPQKEAGPTKVAERAEEATNVAAPAEEATKDSQTAKGAKPATLQIGPLPKLLLAKHEHLLELYLLGQLKKPIWTDLLPVSLRALTLSGSKVETDMMPGLGDRLKNLRTFRLLANSLQGTYLRFTKDGFPRLMILKIWKLPQLQEVVIDEGAMPRLKELEFRYLDKMRNVKGIKGCNELKTVREVLKKGAKGFVDNLENDLGERTILYKIEEIEMVETMHPDHSHIEHKDEDEDRDKDEDQDEDQDQDQDEA